MRIPIYQVDAFSSRVFAGNPAAICPLESWLDDATLQAIAAENNLAETAFYVPEGDRFRLRWFTPAVEVDLCGHATLAAALVIDRPEVRFITKSGDLTVTRNEDLFSMDFPSRPPQVHAGNPGLIQAVGGSPQALLAARDYLIVYETEEEVRALKPNMEGLMEIDRFAVIVTAPGKRSDFVSRFFAPNKGIPEDPVTGSAHCTLTPYWAKRLGKDKLHALQVSARGGELWLEQKGERVAIAGNGTLYMEGAIYI
jgi:predicted PhzF superfamily epimerase YddE/YHI9